MAFLAPAFLALAALAGVPLLVHLLRRKVARTVEFPAVRYLTRMEQEHSRERKVRHRLLLFLRILAVLAISLALARPLARWGGVGHAPVALAIVLDNSMSTGAVRDGHTVLSELRSDVRGLLGSLTAADRAWVVTADGRIFGGSLESVQEAVGTVVPLGGRGDLTAATRRALLLVQGGAPRAPVVAVVTDGQQVAWTGAPTDSTEAPVVDAGKTPVRLLVHGGRSVRNASVLSAQAEPLHWTPSGEVVFTVAARDTAPWRVTLDGRTVARGVVRPDSTGAPVTIRQRLASTAVGWVRGAVELDADELRGDDSRAFAVRVAPPPTVRLVAASGPFLTAALTTLIEEHRLLRVGATDPDAVRARSGGGAGTTVPVTVAAADAPGVSGPVFLTGPSDPVQVGEANRTLARLGIPWRFGAVARDPAQTRGRDGLDGVAVRLRYPLQWSPGTGPAAASLRTDTMATVAGQPWAVAGAVAGVGYVLVASPFDPEATDLPIRATFVPWLLDALARRLGDDGQILTATAGSTLVDRRIGVASALERPDGATVPVTGDRVTLPPEGGVYFLRQGPNRIGALVVNADAAESDLRAEPVATTGSAFRARVSGRAVAVDTTASAWRRHVLDQAAGQSLVWPLLLIALLAVLAEAWVSRVTRNRLSDATD